MNQNINICLTYKGLSVLSGFLITDEYLNPTKIELYKNMSTSNLKNAYECRNTKNNDGIGIYNDDKHLNYLLLKYECKVI